MGRRRNLPNINSPDWAIRMQAERQAVNFVVQGRKTDSTLCVCFSQLLFIFHLSEVGFQTASLTWRVCLLFVVYVFLFVCTGSAADLCKMAMIRIFNLVSSSSSLSARYHL